jgi:hypothetical protein
VTVLWLSRQLWRPGNVGVSAIRGRSAFAECACLRRD